MQATPRPKPVPLHLRAARWRVAPAPPPAHALNKLLKNEGPPQPTLREEIAAYKASIRARKAARLADVSSKPKKAKKQKPQNPIQLNRESSQFRAAFSEWFAYYKSLAKYIWNRARHRAIPVLCCLTAEVDNGAYEPSSRRSVTQPEQ
jgi:hypothetical protein